MGEQKFAIFEDAIDARQGENVNNLIICVNYVVVFHKGRSARGRRIDGLADHLLQEFAVRGLNIPLDNPSVVRGLENVVSRDINSDILIEEDSEKKLIPSRVSLGTVKINDMLDQQARGSRHICRKIKHIFILKVSQEGVFGLVNIHIVKQ